MYHLVGKVYNTDDLERPDSQSRNRVLVIKKIDNKKKYDFSGRIVLI